jgi:hypothetical protein
LQPTANRVLTVCLSRGGNPNPYFSQMTDVLRETFGNYIVDEST